MRDQNSLFAVGDLNCGRSCVAPSGYVPAYNES